MRDTPNGSHNAPSVGSALPGARAPRLTSSTVEKGFNGIQIQHWGGIFVPRGTPAAVIDRLHGAAQAAMRDDTNLRSQLASAG